MLQWVYTYVENVSSKYFSYFHLDIAFFNLDVANVANVIHVCCKRMFQMFRLLQTYVARVLFECCVYYSDYTHMLHAYVLICFTLF
jgi:hypothetical protein